MADERRRQAPRRTRRRRIVRIVGIVVASVLALAIVGGLVWASTPYRAEADGIAAAEADARITVDDEGDVVVLRPTAEATTTLAGRGIVFFAGARVDAAAYVATFRDVAAAGATVVLVRPTLNLAIVELRPLSTFTDAAPDVDAWSVGGHSMGGVRACTYAEDDAVQALVLLASYCSLGDLSGRDDLTVLSLTGSRDGVLRQDAADDARDLLPSDATFVELEGVNHAQFGDYGAQPGDDEATISDDAAHAEIATTIVDALDG